MSAATSLSVTVESNSTAAFAGVVTQTLTSTFRENPALIQVILEFANLAFPKIFAKDTTIPLTPQVVPAGTVSFIRQQRTDAFFRIIGKAGDHSILSVDLTKGCAQTILRIDQTHAGTPYAPGFGYSSANIARNKKVFYGLINDAITCWSRNVNSLTFTGKTPLKTPTSQAVTDLNFIDADPERELLFVTAKGCSLVLSASTMSCLCYFEESGTFLGCARPPYYVLAGAQISLLTANYEPNILAHGSAELSTAACGWFAAISCKQQLQSKSITLIEDVQFRVSSRSLPENVVVDALKIESRGIWVLSRTVVQSSGRRLSNLIRGVNNEPQWLTLYDPVEFTTLLELRPNLNLSTCCIGGGYLLAVQWKAEENAKGVPVTALAALKL